MTYCDYCIANAMLKTKDSQSTENDLIDMSERGSAVASVGVKDASHQCFVMIYDGVTLKNILDGLVMKVILQRRQELEFKDACTKSCP